MTTRRISPRGITLIEQTRPFLAQATVGPDGMSRIGYGHVIRKHEAFPAPITPEAGLCLLYADLDPVEIYLTAVFPHLHQNRYDAVASFALDLGLGVFEASCLFELLKARRFNDAANEFQKWTFPGNPRRKCPERVQRRDRERALFLTPEYH